MPKNKQIMLMLGCFFIVGFIGIVAGSWFSGWRTAQAKPEAMSEFRPMDQPLIQVGDKFPDVTLLDAYGESSSLSEIITDKKTIIMFLEPGCTPCTEAIQSWSDYNGKIPSDVQIVGIASSEPRYTFSYIDRLEFPYLFFCDTAHEFVIEYGVNGFPGAMGIDEKGVVSFGYRHIHNKFSPLDAYKLLIAENIP